MLIGARTGAWAASGAPLPYLRRVAYLESHGNEFLDTLFIPDFRVIQSFMVEYEIGFWKNKYGVEGANGTNGIGYWYSNYGSKSQYYNTWANSTNIKSSTNSFDKVVYKRTRTQSLLSINDSNFNVREVNVVPYEGHSFYLFWISNYNTKKSECRIKSTKIFSDEEMIRSLIPVLDLTGRPAMYDEVSGEMFYNQGTGEFTWEELA